MLLKQYRVSPACMSDVEHALKEYRATVESSDAPPQVLQRPISTWQTLSFAGTAANSFPSRKTLTAVETGEMSSLFRKPFRFLLA
jgi:hypothetical protein